MYFKSIEAYDFSGIEMIKENIDINLPYEVFNLNGVRVGNSTDNLSPGIYIVRQGSIVNKIAVK